MGFVEGFAGFAYLLGDFVATIAFGCAIWIAGAAFINLGSDRPINAPAKIYLAWIMSVILGIIGQIAIFLTQIKQTVSGIFSLSPNYPLITLVGAISLLIISRFLRRSKYS